MSTELDVTTSLVLRRGRGNLKKKKKKGKCQFVPPHVVAPDTGVTELAFGLPWQQGS